MSSRGISGVPRPLNRILTGGVLPEDDVTMIQQFYDDQAAPAAALRDAFALAASLPGYQWY